MDVQKIESLADLTKYSKAFVQAHPNGGCFGLRGELGAGKTTFVREVIAHLAELAAVPVPRVISPTYVFHQQYPLGSRLVEHFDLYRLENATEASLMELGYFETVELALQRQGFVFVEWPERLLSAASQLDQELIFSISSLTTREITKSSVNGFSKSP